MAPEPWNVYEDLALQCEDIARAERAEWNDARVELTDEDEYWYPDARG